MFANQISKKMLRKVVPMRMTALQINIVHYNVHGVKVSVIL